MKFNKEKFLALVSEDASPALENAKWSIENKYWLRKSRKVSIRVLMTLKAKKMSQKELAKQMGVSPQQINKIVKGGENLTLQTISKLEQVLDVALMEVPKKDNFVQTESARHSFSIPTTFKSEKVDGYFVPSIAKRSSNLQVYRTKKAS